MLPSVDVRPQTERKWYQVLVGYDPDRPLQDNGGWFQVKRNFLRFWNPVALTFKRATGAAPWAQYTRNRSGSPDDRTKLPPNPRPETPTTPMNTSGSPDDRNRSYGEDFFERYKMREQQTVNYVLAALEQGDTSVLSAIPRPDLEAMGLGDYAASGVGGGAANTLAAMTGIGTGVDESKDMTPEQLEARYWQNREIEAQFLSSLRWDAQRRKYVTVGEWLRRERKKYNKKGRRRSPGRPEAPAETPQEAPQFTVQQAGVVSFNTATG